MFGNFGPTEFDLRFYVLGIPVRVHPIFWFSAAVIGWVPERFDLLLIHMICIFVSVLIHELGHAIVTRMFGWNPEIVLEFFGGYATSMRHTTWKDIAVSFAGPAAGLALASILLITKIILAANQMLPDNEYFNAAIRFLIFVNYLWSILNLVPVLPLDGGQICRELCLWVVPRSGLQIAVVISIVVSATLGLIGYFVFGHQMLLLFFGYFCFLNIQTLQQNRRGYW